VIISGRVAVKDASPVIEQCTLYGASCAIQVAGKSSPRITGNRVTANKVGLALTGPEDSPMVAKNTFYNNDYAVVAKDFGSPRITGNLFYGNKAYNLVNQSVKALPAPWNDFRTGDASAIAKTLYDSAKNPLFGPVQYRPFAPPVERGETRTAKGQDKFRERFSLTLDGSFASSQGAGVPAGLNNGLGNSFRMEYQFKPFMSIGVNFGYQTFVGNGRTGTAGMLDLMGRVIPFQDGGVETYLIGGAGINPLYDREATPWIGRWHALAGIGTRIALDANWGLDVAGIYNFYTPLARHVDAFSARMGVGYSFGL
jgi:parallel beta-helix repeat protein